MFALIVIAQGVTIIELTLQNEIGIHILHI
jgi:hypothetical protein